MPKGLPWEGGAGSLREKKKSLVSWLPDGYSQIFSLYALVVLWG